MINQNSIATVNSSIFSSKFRKPCYETYCFSGIPGLIAELLGSSPISKGLPSDVMSGLPSNTKHIIAIFLDALGWSNVEDRLESSTLLKEFTNHAVISKLTAQFPSTTAAHITTLATGLPVGQHGVYEWNLYEPTIQAVIRSLPFSYVNDDSRDTLVTYGYSPKILIPGLTLSEHLVQSGISVNIFQDNSIASSAYSKTAYKLAETIPYRNLDDALINLSEKILSSTDKSYSLIYYDRIDSAAHHHGPKSNVVNQAIDQTFKKLEKILIKNFIGKVKDCYLLIISDHGQVGIDPKSTVYLNKIIPKLEEWILKDKNQSPIVPAGGPRDFFLHLKKDFITEAKNSLEQALTGIGEVYLVNDLIEQGFFGDPKRADALRARIGDLVALPYQGESFWWAGMKRSILKDKGFHGGLTPDEMDIPFIIYPL